MGPGALSAAQAGRAWPHVLSAMDSSSRLDLQFRVLDAQAIEASPKTSIDYAVMEHTKRVVVIPADIGWSDVGAWSTVMDLSERDGEGNSIQGDGVVMGAHNVLVRSPNQLTAVVGVSDVIVVTTQDAVLVLKASEGRRSFSSCSPCQ